MSSKAQPWSECGDERLVMTGRPGFSIKQEAAEVCIAIGDYSFTAARSLYTVQNNYPARACAKRG